MIYNIFWWANLSKGKQKKLQILKFSKFDKLATTAFDYAVFNASSVRAPRNKFPSDDILVNYE